MGRKRVTVLPQTQAILEQLGEQIKTARLRILEEASRQFENGGSGLEQRRQRRSLSALGMPH